MTETPNDTTTKPADPDHGIDPRTVPGTPQAAAAQGLGDPALDEAPVGYVDVQMRKRVNRRKAKGLACMMGPDFPECKILIRPWSARPIQIWREKYGEQLRARNPKLKSGDDLDPADKIELNRSTAVMSIMGLEGNFWTGPGEKHTFAFPESGDAEGQKKARAFVSKFFLIPFDQARPESADEIDMDVLQLLMGLNEGLSKVAYQEIDRLGEHFVYGSTEALDYGDSNQ